MKVPERRPGRPLPPIPIPPIPQLDGLGSLSIFKIIGVIVTMIAAFIFTTKDPLIKEIETIKENKEENNNKPIGVTS